MRSIKRIVLNYIKLLFTKLYSRDISCCNVFENDSIVSFDVFDTLIRRSVKNPADVFDRICSDISDFRINRITAERVARQACGKEDCTLSEIYEQMACLSKEQKSILHNNEIEAEMEVCYADKEMLEYFNKCRNKKKKIIIVSDMYLSSETIKRILTRNGYDLNGIRVYVSSEIGLTKRSGNLFKYIQKKEGTSDILHIGDNVFSDYFMAKKSGINAFLRSSWNVRDLKNRFNEKLTIS